MLKLKKLIKNGYFRKGKIKANILRTNPQQHGRVLVVRITTPRKPNSARRKTVKLLLPNTKLHTNSYIPGKGHNLKLFSHVLIRGVGPRDLPGVTTRCIRGALDLQGIDAKTRRRSIYGVKKRKIYV